THARGMELHAWLNPYRVTSSAKQTLPKGHIYHSHPERFVRYDGKLYFDPGRPENREFIVRIVDDIITRYDVDGIHFDDYFYPYPVAKKEFPDNESYALYGKGMKRDDWRRKNVDLLIEEIHSHISATRPWVRFGISPFGIWRNKTSDPRGSDTNGLQNYDALYADVLLWEEKGWIDYLLPQLYWEMNHKAASYKVLVDWWNNSAGRNRHLYIGQDVERTMKRSELDIKVELTRKNPNINGNCWWPGYSVCRNFGGVADSLATGPQASVALVPSYSWLRSGTPEAVSCVRIAEGNKIEWLAPEVRGKTEDVVRFVVYRFSGTDNIDTNDAGAIVAVTPECNYTPTKDGVYVITALDRVNNESEASDPVVITL
ncbi:MAG: family 10 glycosylhydrolase, partial [Muribaculaceae bacterium]|nr:family 10 glycosylhydrolase [Muribaculaceae bacterium]